MKNISVQVFGTREDAENQAGKEGSKKGQKVCGPIPLGTVGVFDHTVNKDRYFEDFAGKWGIVIFY